MWTGLRRRAASLQVVCIPGLNAAAVEWSGREWLSRLTGLVCGKYLAEEVAYFPPVVLPAKERSRTGKNIDGIEERVCEAARLAGRIG